MLPFPPSDRPFHNFRAQDQEIGEFYIAQETSSNGFLSSKSCEWIGRAHRTEEDSRLCKGNHANFNSSFLTRPDPIFYHFRGSKPNDIGLIKKRFLNKEMLSKRKLRDGFELNFETTEFGRSP